MLQNMIFKINYRILLFLHELRKIGGFPGKFQIESFLIVFYYCSNIFYKKNKN